MTSDGRKITLDELRSGLVATSASPDNVRHRGRRSPLAPAPAIGCRSPDCADGVRSARRAEAVNAKTVGGAVELNGTDVPAAVDQGSMLTRRTTIGESDSAPTARANDHPGLPPLRHIDQVVRTAGRRAGGPRRTHHQRHRHVPRHRRHRPQPAHRLGRRRQAHELLRRRRHPRRHRHPPRPTRHRPLHPDRLALGLRRRHHRIPRPPWRRLEPANPVPPFRHLTHLHPQERLHRHPAHRLHRPVPIRRATLAPGRRCPPRPRQRPADHHLARQNPTSSPATASTDPEGRRLPRHPPPR